ncbi:hypothetical protein C8Q77DRAFT_108716 [Trametes polyzona]|nr:hypothetical protein C8Q77DRAFT_108716 [Trametes polyzona]
MVQGFSRVMHTLTLTNSSLNSHRARPPGGPPRTDGRSSPTNSCTCSLHITQTSSEESSRPQISRCLLEVPAPCPPSPHDGRSSRESPSQGSSPGSSDQWFATWPASTRTTVFPLCITWRVRLPRPERNAQSGGPQSGAHHVPPSFAMGGRQTGTTVPDSPLSSLMWHPWDARPTAGYYLSTRLGRIPLGTPAILAP